jgi:hypothetical protein
LVVFNRGARLTTIRGMKTSGVLLFAALLSLTLAACTTPGADAAAQANQQLEAKGSPFRYKPIETGNGTALVMTLLPLPAGPSKANPDLAKKVMEGITSTEHRKGRSVANLEEVRYLQDGREVWVLHTLGDGVAYVIAMENPNNPRSSVRITGPTTYSK